MKRLRTGAVALSLLLALSACGAGDGPMPTAAPTETAPAVRLTPAPETVYDDSLVELVFGSSGTFCFDSGEEEAFSFAVPRLKAEGPGAQTLNRELEEHWLKLAREADGLLKQDQIPEIFQVGYETHWNGSLLSLVLWSASPYWEADRQVYNYDFADDTWVKGYELAHWCGLAPEELRTAVARAAGLYFDSHPEQYSASGAELAQLRARAVSRKAVEETQVYLDRGTVKALAVMPWDFSPQAEIMEVPTGTDDALEVSIDSDWVRAELRDDRVFLTFHDVSSAMWLLSDDLQFEAPYEVEGLYGRYTDMAMGLLGMEFRPFLFLTDLNGRVTCCNIMGCAEAGDRFFAAGPLEAVRDVVYYDYGTEDMGEAGELPTILAHTRAGEDISLNQPAYESSRLLPQQLQQAWTGETGELSLTIGTELGPQGVRWTRQGQSWEGWMYYLGTDQDGLHFKVSLYTDLSDAAQCRLTLPCSGAEADGDSTVELVHCSGPAVPGLADRGSITLYGGTF